MKNEVVNLIKVSYERDEDGYVVSKKEISSENVFAEVKSVTRTEFYNAMHAGISAEIAFVINNDEYNDENVVEYDGKSYYVVRTYCTSISDIELICSNKAVKTNGNI